mmetsp:Transcript_49853/g.132366  ORF Transcript_49853/g.132366 Transcript_49853/m.132366 type:complete len:207 (+) Transcript_49853:436-1056(+)
MVVEAEGDANSKPSTKRMVVFKGKNLVNQCMDTRQISGTMIKRMVIVAMAAHSGTASGFTVALTVLCSIDILIERPRAADRRIQPTIGAMAPKLSMAPPTAAKGPEVSTKSTLCIEGTDASTKENANASMARFAMGLTTSVHVSQQLCLPPTSTDSRRHSEVTEMVLAICSQGTSLQRSAGAMGLNNGDLRSGVMPEERPTRCRST